jgi:hypothetical protein
MNAQTEIILNQDGEQTDLAVPDNFGHGLSFLNPADMPDLDAAEVGFNIQPESMEFKNPGESLRAVFNGFTYLKTKDQANKGQYLDKQAAVLQTKTGIKINMGANLLKQLALIPVGTAVQITYKGEEKTNSGNKVKVYDVNLLNIPRANVTPFPQVKAQTPPPADNHPMTYDEAKQITIKVQGSERFIGELSKAQLDYLVEHPMVARNAEAAKIVLEHDFNMTSIDDENPFN